MEDNEELYYDEAEAVAFIQEYIKQEYEDINVSDEDIEYITDLVYDYYEENHFFDDDKDESSSNDDSDEKFMDIDQDEIFDYVVTRVEEDNLQEKYTDEVIGAILDGEYSYCEYKNIFVDAEDEEEA